MTSIPSTMPAAFCLTTQAQIDPKACFSFANIRKKVSATFMINLPDNVLVLGR